MTISPLARFTNAVVAAVTSPADPLPAAAIDELRASADELGAWDQDSERDAEQLLTRRDADVLAQIDERIEAALARALGETSLTASVVQEARAAIAQARDEAVAAVKAAAPQRRASWASQGEKL